MPEINELEVLSCGTMFAEGGRCACEELHCCFLALTESVAPAAFFEEFADAKARTEEACARKPDYRALLVDYRGEGWSDECFEWWVVRIGGGWPDILLRG